MNLDLFFKVWLISKTPSDFCKSKINGYELVNAMTDQFCLGLYDRYMTAQFILKQSIAMQLLKDLGFNFIIKWYIVK